MPSDLRREAWFACSGARELKKMGPMDSYYEKLLVMRVDQKVVDQIELDLARTFPANEKYERGEGGQRGNDVLRRMLYAYARHNRKTGYCQGMNYIAAFLWLVMGDEEKAFWTFTALLDVVLPSDVHARDIKGTISQYKILHKLLQSNVPKVARHLKELDVDLVMIASKWLLCLFVESFPATTAARVLDCLTYEGEKVWFRVAIAMMKMYERDILECDSLPDVMLCLKHAFANQTDADELLKFTFERVSLSNKTIAASSRDRGGGDGRGTRTTSAGDDTGARASLYSRRVVTASILLTYIYRYFRKQPPRRRTRRRPCPPRAMATPPPSPRRTTVSRVIALCSRIPSE